MNNFLLFLYDKDTINISILKLLNFFPFTQSVGKNEKIAII